MTNDQSGKLQKFPPPTTNLSLAAKASLRAGENTLSKRHAPFSSKVWEKKRIYQQYTPLHIT
ncbi:hypothetical protein Prudu_013535 [Prunus dulcis]|uniref:Uncharacterized protein n=1 Tax=Prunus dulcis TaxID=3755 RepID=A0A4Y1RG38_PRUDU|nr:hypothetical protein Prudu_013535 [Prunus dulcis]